MLSKNLLGGNYWIKQDQPSACLCFTSHWSHLPRTISFHFFDGFTIAQLRSENVTKKLTFPDIWSIAGKDVWDCLFAVGTARKRGKIRLVLTHSSGGIPGGAWSFAWSLGYFRVFYGRNSRRRLKFCLEFEYERRNERRRRMFCRSLGQHQQITAIPQA